MGKSVEILGFEFRRDRVIISPLLFKLYSEFMIKEAMQDVKGVAIVALLSRI